MVRYIDVDKLLNKLPNDLPYKASVKRVIMQAPTADVAEVKHGEWTLETDEEMPNPMFKLVVCSVCNGKANGTYHYCPNCGAKMDGKKEGTT